MAKQTAIEWTDATWNPIAGCSVVSPGCTHCYAMKMASRIEAMHEGRHAIRAPSKEDIPPTHYAGLTRSGNGGPVWTGKMVLAPEHVLIKPLRWREPRRIFVNSMSDLFHESVPDEWIDRIFAVMAVAPQHTFQVLTKRSARMRAYIGDMQPWSPRVSAIRSATAAFTSLAVGCTHAINFPLPNVWLGVSTEDQRRADERIPDLMATPAAVRFVSAEPMLGAIDFTKICCPNGCCPPDYCNRCHPDGGIPTGTFDALGGGELHQIIVGGESGPGARPMHPQWARDIRDQCAAAGVPFFFKQWGAFEIAVDRERDDPDWRLDYGSELADNRKTAWLNLTGGRGFHGEKFHVMRRVGKAGAGRLLDGVEHNGMPASIA